MHKEQLEKNLESIENRFNLLFCFDKVFYTFENGQLVLNIDTIRNISSQIVSKITIMIEDPKIDNNHKRLLEQLKDTLDFKAIINTLEDSSFEHTNDQNILNIMNRFVEFKELFIDVKNKILAS
ncbi:MAG: hypothetical protein U9Q33_11120 [Campylobacterota bacterium]|nr:hypothetical protein [Campylobacterota bacterium]